MNTNFPKFGMSLPQEQRELLKAITPTRTSVDEPETVKRPGMVPTMLDQAEFSIESLLNQLFKKNNSQVVKALLLEKLLIPSGKDTVAE